jgi:hypothetical protein
LTVKRAVASRVGVQIENSVVKVAEIDQLEVNYVHESAKENQSCGGLIDCDQHQMHDDLGVPERT